MNKLIAVLIFSVLSVSCSTDSKPEPSWTKEKKTIFSDYVCGADHKRWINYNKLQPLDSFSKTKKIVRYLAEKDSKLYTLLFFNLESIGDYEIEDVEPKEDELQDGCAFIGVKEYHPSI